MYPNDSLRLLFGKDVARSTLDEFTGTVTEVIARVCPNWQVVSAGNFKRRGAAPGVWQSFILHQRKFGFHPEDIWVVKPVFISCYSMKRAIRPGWNEASLNTRRERLMDPLPPYFAVDTGIEDLLGELADTIHAARDSGNVQADAARAAVRGFLATDVSEDENLSGIQTLLGLGGFDRLADACVERE
jgi:hypothetical protein